MAMKNDFYQKRLTAQEIMMHSHSVAFPLFLQVHNIRNIAVVYISLGKWHPFWSSFQENDAYIFKKNAVKNLQDMVVEMGLGAPVSVTLRNMYWWCLRD